MGIMIFMLKSQRRAFRWHDCIITLSVRCTLYNVFSILSIVYTVRNTYTSV